MKAEKAREICLCDTAQREAGRVRYTRRVNTQTGQTGVMLKPKLACT